MSDKLKARGWTVPAYTMAPDIRSELTITAFTAWLCSSRLNPHFLVLQGAAFPV